MLLTDLHHAIGLANLELVLLQNACQRKKDTITFYVEVHNNLQVNRWTLRVDFKLQEINRIPDMNLAPSSFRNNF